jgi:hypothetical protein
MGSRHRGSALLRLALPELPVDLGLALLPPERHLLQLLLQQAHSLLELRNLRVLCRDHLLQLLHVLPQLIQRERHTHTHSLTHYCWKC